MLLNSTSNLAFLQYSGFPYLNHLVIALDDIGCHAARPLDVRQYSFIISIQYSDGIIVIFPLITQDVMSL